MKNSLLSLICIFANLFYVQAQTLYGLTPYGGDEGAGALIKFIPSTNNLTVSKSFESGAGSPTYTNLIQASDGKLYGMTTGGGKFGHGVIFSFERSVGTYTRLKDFDGANGENPQGSLIPANNGKLYGMTSQGGSNNRGVIFSFDPATSNYTKLKDLNFTDGANPYGSLVQASDGKLYGMTREGGSSNAGVIFSFNLLSSVYTKLKDFDFLNGGVPYGDLVQANNGKLYGMTSQGGSSNYGVIFSFDPATSNYTKLKDLDGINGSEPTGSLMQASNGKLYGTTLQGGIGDNGVIFSFDPISSNYTKLKDFDYDGINGADPYGRLMQASNGMLYGLTRYGGVGGYGTIFSFNLSSSAYTKLVDFDRTKGTFPFGSLMQANDGKLYGMTHEGGNYYYGDGAGVIFSFDPSSSTYIKVKDFNYTDGTNTSGSLVQASNGKLYGMTNLGGSNGCGVVFSLDPSTSIYTKLVDFNFTSVGYFGLGVYGSRLMQANDGKLYGITQSGGTNGGFSDCFIFSFDPSTSTFTKLKDFGGTDGSWGSLIQASDEKLYGMTRDGGSTGSGVIFSFDPSTSIYTKLKDFDFANGGRPSGNLMQASDGKLYGMTGFGGSGDYGVIFSFDPSTSTYAKLKDFDGTNGANPYGSLIEASDGKLYGMTREGGSTNAGVIFSFVPSSSTYTKLKDFDWTNGGGPNGSLLQASDGKLYGMTNYGGSSNRGVIFSFDPSDSTYSKLKDFDGTNGAFGIGGNFSLGSGFIELKSGTTPVTLINFTGKNSGSINQLTWKVANEQELKHYELQRGADGKHFTGIAQIKATGDNSYTYNDAIATEVSSVYYYRLKSVDKDGTFTYSSICTIRFNAANTNIIISPNPATKSIRLETSSGGPVTGNSATATIRIYTSAMQLLQTKTISKADGNAISIPVEKLAAGIYFLQFANANGVSTIKFVKE